MSVRRMFNWVFLSDMKYVAIREEGKGFTFWVPGVEGEGRGTRAS
jgi:hypothetical protein